MWPAGVPGSVAIVDPSRDDSAWPDAECPSAIPMDTKALVRRSQEARARARATRDQILRGRSRRQVLHDSAFARLQARHESMPVIEQAKGIIMAQQRCGPEQAFDLLRQASQRTHVKLNELAARIVGHIVSSSNGDNVTPISLGAAQYPRPEAQAQPPAG